MTWRIEFEDDDMIKAWLEQRVLLLGARKVNDARTFGDGLNVNTILTYRDEGGWLQTVMFRLTMPEVIDALAYADNMSREYTRDGSGRYPARVLVSTTSKERRTGATKRY